MKSFVSCDSVTHEGESNTWFTPPEIIRALGPFDLDPCSQTFRPFDTAAKHYCEDAGQDGLQLPWAGRVWLNPPYGKTIGAWLEKLAKHNNGLALVFNRSETSWGQAALCAAAAVNFLKGRIAFIKRDGVRSTNAGTGSMLLAFGEENIESLTRLPGVAVKLF